MRAPSVSKEAKETNTGFDAKKAQVHASLRTGGGSPTTDFGKRAKTFFDPVLCPLVKLSWPLASILLTAVPILCFYLVGGITQRLYPGGTPGTALLPSYNFVRNNIFPAWAGTPMYPSLFSTVFTWIVCIIFTTVDIILPSWAAKRRVQQGREGGDFPPLGLWNAVRHQASLYIYLLPVFAYQYAVGGPSLYGLPWMEPCLENCDALPDEAPTVGEFAVHFSLNLLMFDTAYWYWHWMHHHHRTLWVNVHRHHHEYNSPFAFVSQYLHPLEFAATGLFSIMPSVALGCHPFTAWCNILFGVWLSLDAHTGYDLECGLQHFPWGVFGGTPHHDEHHRRPNSNFQPFLTYWEHLCGTHSNAGSSMTN